MDRTTRLVSSSAAQARPIVQRVSTDIAKNGMPRARTAFQSLPTYCITPGRRVRAALVRQRESAWANFVESSWMTTPDRGLAAQIYMESTVRARAGDDCSSVILEMRTKYPLHEVIDIYFTSPKVVAFPLWLRIPSWVNDPAIRVNGILQTIPRRPATYARLLRAWAPGDRVSLQLPTASGRKR